MQPGISYQVRIHDAHAHLFAVRLRISQPAPQQELRLPVWIPGSYLVREFARHIHSIRAMQGSQPCAHKALNKNSWQFNCTAEQALEVEYLAYAYDTSVRTAYLDAQRGFFNGTSLFMRVLGQEQNPHALEIIPSPGWAVYTGLSAPNPTAAQHHYLAQNYDALVDGPVEMGQH